ncbi:MAG: cell division protein FtsL [Schwartzia sp.]|nr:cell division protein FtsL [Schwartzia sp. (in: firmicutes)]MBR1761676.1 cell division protein FtsL [Schwartzia sp. (in: firmicutes)]MBR1885050.1 cell division protein FtsL [Schwartzia sp. (in: firmicutes)]
MPQAARQVWSEETEERRVVRKLPKRRPTTAVRAHVDTELRAKAFVMFLIFALTAAVTLIRSEESAMRGYELVQLRQQARQLEQENRNIELYIAEMKAPQRIKDRAINELGMVVPKEFYFAAESDR